MSAAQFPKNLEVFGIFLNHFNKLSFVGSEKFSTLKNLVDVKHRIVEIFALNIMAPFKRLETYSFGPSSSDSTCSKFAQKDRILKIAKLHGMDVMIQLGDYVNNECKLADLSARA